MKAKQFTKETIRDLGIYARSFPAFEVGDAIVVTQRIKEGDKERLQDFEGDVIAIHNHGASSTFTVRKMGANNVSVERIFPYYSPLVDSIAFKRKGNVRRARLFYLRDRVGKSARIQEKIVTREQREQQEASATTEQE